MRTKAHSFNNVRAFTGAWEQGAVWVCHVIKARSLPVFLYRPCMYNMWLVDHSIYPIHWGWTCGAKVRGRVLVPGMDSDTVHNLLSGIAMAAAETAIFEHILKWRVQVSTRFPSWCTEFSLLQWFLSPSTHQLCKYTKSSCMALILINNCTNNFICNSTYHLTSFKPYNSPCTWVRFMHHADNVRPHSHELLQPWQL